MSEVRAIFLESQGSEPPAGTGWKRQGHAADHVNRGKVRLAEDAQDHLERNPLSAKSSFLTFDDLIRVATTLSEVASRTVTFDYTVSNAETGQVLATARTVLISLDAAQRVVTLPPDVRELLNACALASS